jgi:hypothetical protein
MIRRNAGESIEGEARQRKTIVRVEGGRRGRRRRR